MTGLKALLLVSSAAALQAPCTRRSATHLAAVSLAELAEQSSLPPADKSRITVLSDADAVGAEVWKRIDEAGKRAVEGARHVHAGHPGWQRAQDAGW